jgi:hypothetical protein
MGSVIFIPYLCVFVNEHLIFSMPIFFTGYSGFLVVYNGTEPNCTIENLRNGMVVRLRAMAKNENGPGAWSEIFETSTCAVPPKAPDLVSIGDIRKTEAVVTFRVPDAGKFEGIFEI